MVYTAEDRVHVLASQDMLCIRTLRLLRAWTSERQTLCRQHGSFWRISISSAGLEPAAWMLLDAKVFGTQVYVLQTRRAVPSVPCACVNRRSKRHVLQCRQLRELEEAVAKLLEACRPARPQPEPCGAGLLPVA